MSDVQQHRPTDMTPARKAAAREQLIAVVNGELSVRRRPSTPVVVATVVGIGAVASISAVSLLPHAPVTDRSTVECRASLDPDEPRTYVAMATPVTINDGVMQTLPRPEFADAVNLCAQIWQANIQQGNVTGPLRAPASFDDEAPPAGPVPALTLCVADDGHAVVVPSADPEVCSSLGLSGGP